MSSFEQKNYEICKAMGKCDPNTETKIREQKLAVEEPDVRFDRDLKVAAKCPKKLKKTTLKVKEA